MSESLKTSSSTPNKRTDSNESTSQPLIRTYNSVSLQGKDLYEGRLTTVQLHTANLSSRIQDHKESAH